MVTVSEYLSGINTKEREGWLRVLQEQIARSDQVKMCRGDFKLPFREEEVVCWTQLFNGNLAKQAYSLQFISDFCAIFQQNVGLSTPLGDKSKQ